MTGGDTRAHFISLKSAFAQCVPIYRLSVGLTLIWVKPVTHPPGEGPFPGGAQGGEGVHKCAQRWRILISDVQDLLEEDPQNVETCFAGIVSPLIHLTRGSIPPPRPRRQPA